MKPKTKQVRASVEPVASRASAFLFKSTAYRSALVSLGTELRQAVASDEEFERHVELLAQILFGLHIAAQNGETEDLAALYRGISGVLDREDERRLEVPFDRKVLHPQRPRPTWLATGLRDFVRDRIADGVPMGALAEEVVSYLGGTIMAGLPSTQWTDTQRRLAVRTALMRLEAIPGAEEAIVRAAFDALGYRASGNLFKADDMRSARQVVGPDGSD